MIKSKLKNKKILQYIPLQEQGSWNVFRTPTFSFLWHFLPYISRLQDKITVNNNSQQLINRISVAFLFLI